MLMKKFNTICIIDDDPIFVFGTKRLIIQSNFCENILVFENGMEALDYLKPVIENGEDIPDVIFLDLNMPIMDGWQFLDEFTKISTPQSIIIYIVSSSINPADTNRAKLYENVNKYVLKPITQDKLIEMLKANI